MLSKLNTLTARTLVVFALTFVIGVFAVRSAAAHDIGWRWYTSTVYVIDRNTSYGSNISGAVSDYHNNTDLAMYLTNDVYHDSLVHYYQYDAGSGYDPAWTIPYHNNTTPCADGVPARSTGQCNTTDRKVTFAYIYINSNPTWSSVWQTYRAQITRHEMGHVLGMSHGPCEVSVMATAACNVVYNALQAHDKDTMNTWY